MFVTPRSELHGERLKTFTGGGVRQLLAALILILSVSLSTANAQQVFGSIFGTVTDASGAAVANAKVTIADVDKGTKFDVNTNESGNYNKGQLIPGPYKVTIEAAGFQKIVSNNIVVQVDAAAKFDAALKVGDVNTAGRSHAPPPLFFRPIAPTSPRRSPPKQINELPNIGRNLQSMELLQPGTAKLGWQHASDENPQGSVQMVVEWPALLAPWAMSWTEPPTRIRSSESSSSIRRWIRWPKSSSPSRTSIPNSSTSAAAWRPTPPSPEPTRSTATRSSTSSSTLLASPLSHGTRSARRTARRSIAKISLAAPSADAIIKNKLFFFGDAQLNRQAAGRLAAHQRPDGAEPHGQLQRLAGATTRSYQIYDPNTGNQTTGVGRTPLSEQHHSRQPA